MSSSQSSVYLHLNDSSSLGSFACSIWYIGNKTTEEHRKVKHLPKGRKENLREACFINPSASSIGTSCPVFGRDGSEPPKTDSCRNVGLDFKVFFKYNQPQVLTFCYLGWMSSVFQQCHAPAKEQNSAGKCFSLLQESQGFSVPRVLSRINLTLIFSCFLWLITLIFHRVKKNKNKTTNKTTRNQTKCDW